MTMMQLHVFLALKESESFTDAGENLGITQSAVSHALSSLEKELGLVLFHRDRQGVFLTEAGHRIFDHVREIVSRVGRIREEASSLSDLKVGKIRVGSLQSAAIRMIPGLIGAMRQKYPGIEVSVFEGTDQEVHDWVLAETVDLGILTASCGGLETVPLISDRMFGLVPENHPLSGEKILTLDQLSSETIIRSLGSCGMIVSSGFLHAGLSSGVKMIEARNISTISEMVRSGAGSAILPGLAVPRDRSGIRVIPIDPPLFRQVVLAGLKLQSLSPAGKVFVDLAKEWVVGRFQELI